MANDTHPKKPTVALPAKESADNHATLNVQRCYMKDASVEMPNAPEIFTRRAAMEMQMHLDYQSKHLADNTWEVTVRATLTGTLESQTAIIVEVAQAGIFDIQATSDAAREQALAVACPSFIYPYLRVTVANLMGNTGLPVFHIPEINWQATVDAARAQEAAAVKEPKTLH